MSEVSWVIELEIKDGQADGFRKFMEDMVAVTQSDEADTLAYEWFISEDGKNCQIYERYTDSAAVMIHLASFASFGERFGQVADVGFLHIYGSPSDEVKEAVAGLNPTYLAAYGGFHR
jgi:quinol monooxygenase YgiN